MKTANSRYVGDGLDVEDEGGQHGYIVGARLWEWFYRDFTLDWKLSRWNHSHKEPCADASRETHRSIDTYLLDHKR